MADPGRRSIRRSTCRRASTRGCEDEPADEEEGCERERSRVNRECTCADTAAGEGVNGCKAAATPAAVRSRQSGWVCTSCSFSTGWIAGGKGTLGAEAEAGGFDAAAVVEGVECAGRELRCVLIFALLVCVLNVAV